VKFAGSILCCLLATAAGRAAYYPDTEVFVAPANGRGSDAFTRSPHEDSGAEASPAGNVVAFMSARGGDGLRIYVSRLDGTAAHPLTPPMFDGDVALVGRDQVGDDRASRIAWSPDGRKLAFDATTTTAPPGCFRSCGTWRIYVINADGSSLARVAEGNRMSWSPDGRRLAYRTNVAEESAGSIATVDLTTGARVIRVPRRPSTYSVESPSWSSDGLRIAFESVATKTIASEVDVLDLRRRTVTRWAAGRDPIYAPRGAQLAFIRGTGIYMTSGPGRGRRVATCYYHCAVPQWSQDGARLAWIDGGVVMIGPLNGVHTRPIGTDAFDERPSWTRDGSRVFYTSAVYRPPAK
jgi:Tol biopolymer transport system component